MDLVVVGVNCWTQWFDHANWSLDTIWRLNTWKFENGLRSVARDPFGSRYMPWTNHFILFLLEMIWWIIVVSVLSSLWHNFKIFSVPLPKGLSACPKPYILVGNIELGSKHIVVCPHDEVWRLWLDLKTDILEPYYSRISNCTLDGAQHDEFMNLKHKMTAKVWKRSCTYKHAQLVTRLWACSRYS